MTGSSDFARDYQLVSDWVASHGSAQGSVTYVNQIQDLCDRTAGQVEAAARTDQGIHVVKGFVAERMHVGTYNLDLARQSRLDLGNEAHLTTPGSTADVTFGIAGADPVQAKYYGTAPATALAISDAKYEGMGKVVQADQIDDVRQATRRWADQFADGDPGTSPAVPAYRRHRCRQIGPRRRPLPAADRT